MGSHQLPPNTPILAVFAFHSDKLNRDFKAETRAVAIQGLTVGPARVVIVVAGVSTKHVAGAIGNFAPHSGVPAQKSVQLVMPLQVSSVVYEIRIVSEIRRYPRMIAQEIVELTHLCALIAPRHVRCAQKGQTQGKSKYQLNETSPIEYGDFHIHSSFVRLDERRNDSFKPETPTTKI